MQYIRVLFFDPKGEHYVLPFGAVCHLRSAETRFRQTHAHTGPNR